MIGTIIITAFAFYTIITLIMLLDMENLSFVDSKYGMLKFFCWPIYLPLIGIKNFILFLYCKVLIKVLDKIFKKK